MSTQSSVLREEALALGRRVVDAVNRHDVPTLASCYTEQAVLVSPVFKRVVGREAIAATWTTLLSSFPDLALETSDLLIDSDRVAILGRVTATDHSGWFGLPPTGGIINYRVVVLLTLAEGRIVRDERIYDSTGVIERLEKARLDRELKTAADVQAALLFRTAHAGCCCESVGHSLPCRAIGGDFFEFVDLPAEATGLAMGDVAGKGPAAALLASMVQGMFIVEAGAGEGPASTLARINQRLAGRSLGARFATMFYGVFSPDGRFTYTNAGHNWPILLTRGEVRRLVAGGPMLGAFGDARFEEETLRPDAGDTVVMFTDGVTEARNARDEEFGEERLLSCLHSIAAGSPPTAFLDGVFSAVKDFCGGAEQGDDITVTVNRFH